MIICSVHLWLVLPTLILVFIIQSISSWTLIMVFTYYFYCTCSVLNCWYLKFKKNIRNNFMMQIVFLPLLHFHMLIYLFFSKTHHIRRGTHSLLFIYSTHALSWSILVSLVLGLRCDKRIRNLINLNPSHE